MPTRRRKGLGVALTGCYRGRHGDGPAGPPRVEFQLSELKVLENIKIEQSETHVRYSIANPKNGSIEAQGAIPFGEWDTMKRNVFDEIKKFPHTMLDIICILLIHSNLDGE